jgi:hypothetical protein
MPSNFRKSSWSFSWPDSVLGQLQIRLEMLDTRRSVVSTFLSLEKAGETRVTASLHVFETD